MTRRLIAVLAVVGLCVPAFAQPAPGECVDNGAFTTNGWDVQGGQVNMGGATLFVDYFFFPAGYNDFVDVNNDCISGFDALQFPPVDQLATEYSGAPISTWWAFNYRSVGSVNGFNEFVDNQLCGTLPTSPPSEEGIFNRFSYASDGIAVPGGANDSGTPFEQCEIQGAFLDVFGSWGVNSGAGVDARWDNRPLADGYGFSPYASSTGYSSQLKGLDRDCSTDGLNFNADLGQTPDEFTLYSLGAGWVPVALLANRGTGLENIKFTEAHHLWTTGRMPNGENFAAGTRDVGSGTRNAAMNSLGIDVSFGRGDSRGDKQSSEDTDVQGWQPNHLQVTNRGGSSRMEGTVQNRRNAVGYTGVSGGSRAAKDATDGKYEILNVWKDTECQVVDSYVRPDIDTILDNCDPCTGYQISGTGSFVVRGNINTNRDPGMECGVWECVGGTNDGDPCVNNTECPGGACVNIGSGLACTSNMHCEVGETCEVVSRCVSTDGISSCSGDFCYEDSDCPMGEFCLPVDGDAKWAAPINGEVVANQAVADYLINMFDSIDAFAGDVEADENNNMPGQQLALSFFLPAGIDCQHSLTDGTAYSGTTPLNQPLQDFVRLNHPMCNQGAGCETPAEYPTPDYGSANTANRSPKRQVRTASGLYSDGSTADFVYWCNGWVTLPDGDDLSRHNRLAADFGMPKLTRDVSDAGEFVQAVYFPREWQKKGIATGTGAGFDLGEMTCDNVVPEVVGDLNGNGSLDKEDLRYFMDGHAMTTGRQGEHLDRRAGAIAIDEAIASTGICNGGANDGLPCLADAECEPGGTCDDAGLPYPWADSRWRLWTPGDLSGLPLSAVSPTFDMTPRPIADFLATGAAYEDGDFRGDVAGRVGPCENTTLPTTCQKYECSVSGLPCEIDLDCEHWTGETCVMTGSGDVCTDGADCELDEFCGAPRCECGTADCDPIETFPTPGAEPTGWDGVVDAKDIDYVCKSVNLDWATVDDAIQMDLSCDMDGNLTVNYDDVTELVTVILDTQIGDLDLNGVKDGSDLTTLQGNLGMPGGWADGDLTCDGFVDFCDESAYNGIFYGTSAVESCKDHNGSRLCLDLTAGGIEPRDGGVTELDVTLNDGTDYGITGADVVVDSGAYAGTVTVSGPVGNVLTLGFSPELADGVHTVELPCGLSFCVRALKGDVDQNGLVSTADSSAVKALFGQPASASPAADLDLSGTVTTADSSAIKALFGGNVGSCN